MGMGSGESGDGHRKSWVLVLSPAASSCVTVDRGLVTGVRAKGTCWELNGIGARESVELGGRV